MFKTARIFLTCLPLIAMAGCAKDSHRKISPGFNDPDARRQDHEFFYGNIWRAAPSPDDNEDHRFFYRSHD